tara:strand:+ start:1148 stop:1555 length:408 start_codon:yes stop_codon:yes gene_type:complete
MKRCGITGKLYSDKIKHATDSAFAYLEKSAKFFNYGDCILADHKRSNDCLNRAYSSITDALRQELLANRDTNVVSEDHWNDLYWTAPHYVHEWTKKCTDLYNAHYKKDLDLSKYVTFILNLKYRKTANKKIWENK